MISYKLVKNQTKEVAINKFIDGMQVASIPFDPDNTDYQAYLAWIAEGNTPLPAEEQA